MIERKVLVLGDIHGCIDEFNELLDKVHYHPGADRLILLGDLVDRGPDSIGVIQRAIEVGAECLMGNHDEKYVRWHRHEEKKAADPKYKNPMQLMRPERLESYRKMV